MAFSIGPNQTSPTANASGVDLTSTAIVVPITAYTNTNNTSRTKSSPAEVRAAPLTQSVVSTPAPGATSTAVNQPTNRAPVITTTATDMRAATLPASSASLRGARVKATRSVPRVNSLAVLLMKAASTSTELKPIDDTTAVVAPPAPRIASSEIPSEP